MASVTPLGTQQPLDAPAIRRVDPDSRRAAVAVLLTGQHIPHDPRVQQFLRYVQSQQLSLDSFWAAYQGSRPVAACLMLPSAGRTAMCFGSPVHGPAAVELASRVVHHALADQSPVDTTLIQALLEPDQRLEARALARAGFTHLATLEYMQRDADVPPAALDLGDPAIRTLHYTDAAHDDFAHAILASYEDTLDCPGLVGLRQIDDIIAGHRATGAFDPRLWFAFYRHDQPVGVMLLASLAQRHTMELVYLGLAKPFRGKGLAKRMLLYALGRASAEPQPTGAPPRRFCLAVDQANTPAKHVYESLGFRINAHKLAMIASLKT